MRECLGLSVGATNLVAVPTAGRPLLRRAILSLGERGPVIGAFVDRVGDPVPLVASDGSPHAGDALLVEALDALTRAVSPARQLEATGVAVPAHWRKGAVAALRARLPGVAVVSDAVATLTALQAHPGLPSRGIVALCDFGGTGTSITLADVGAGFQPVGETVRYEDFSGDLVDQAVLRHVLGVLDVDPSSTSAVASLTQLREQCRLAKERLSDETATAMPGPPGAHSAIRLTRPELEALLHGPLGGFIDELELMLLRYNIAPASLAAIATAGGGARIPLVTQWLSEAWRVPVTTTPNAQLLAATGAALIAARRPDEEAVTSVAVAPLPPAAPVAAAAMPLAWSEEVRVPVPDEARPEMRFDHSEVDAAQELPPLSWYRRPGMLFGVAASLAALAATGLVLTSRSDAAEAAPPAPPAAPSSVPAQPLHAPSPAVPVMQLPAPQTVVVTRPADVPRYVEAPPLRRTASQPQAIAAAPPPAAPAPAPLPAAPPPEPSPTPSPEPPPSPTPAPSPQPEPQPEPGPTPTPEPGPTPTPEPGPTPTPEPGPTPEPEPSPSPQPVPDPSPPPESEPGCVPAEDMTC